MDGTARPCRGPPAGGARGLRRDAPTYTSNYSPGNPGWGHPPLEDEVRATDEGWGLVEDPGNLFGPTIVRWYPTVQWFDGDGFADLLRSSSLYRRLEGDVREPLLDAIAERIRTRMGDQASRRYLSVLRVGQRADLATRPA